MNFVFYKFNFIAQWSATYFGNSFDYVQGGENENTNQLKFV